jgi:hypothetical protein
VVLVRGWIPLEILLEQINCLNMRLGR